MQIDLITFQGPIETCPDIVNMERKVWEVAKAQIDAEAPPGAYEGPRRLAMIRYRQLKLVKRWDVASFVVKALVIAEIEKHNLWSTLEGYKTPEQAAEAEADISPPEYVNIRDLWNIIVPFLQNNDFSVEEFLLKKGNNIRISIPILKSIATGNPNMSARVNRRIEQMSEDIRNIASARGEIVSDGEVRKKLAETVMSLMDGSQRDLRVALDPRAPENARENDPVNSQYPCLVIPQNEMNFILVELDQDGMAEFMSFLHKRCEVDYMFQKDDPKTYPLLKELLHFVESKHGRNTLN
jgi:hypothetical protein